MMKLSHILHADAPCKADEELPWHDYRLTGYWHIAQSFQGRRGFDSGAAAHKGAPLQVTFAPMFVAGDGGRRENPFFLRDALDEFTFESAAVCPVTAARTLARRPNLHAPVRAPKRACARVACSCVVLRTLAARTARRRY